MWSGQLGSDLSDRLGKIDLSEELSYALQRRKGREGAEDPVLQQKNVPRLGSFNGTIMCRELDLLFGIRIHQEADKCS